jgi:hypothetical protein
MSFASEGWLSIMLSGLATVPWLTEMVNLGSCPGPDDPEPTTAQIIRAITTAAATATPP